MVVADREIIGGRGGESINYSAGYRQTGVPSSSPLTMALSAVAKKEKPMLRRLLASAFMFFLAAEYPFQVQGQVPGVAKQPVRQVSVEEIGKSVVLIGRLGVPLGEKMEIVGYWHMPPHHEKDPSLRFTVTMVNHRKLTTPVEFCHEQVEFMDADHHHVVPKDRSQQKLDGQYWTLIAYETGRINIMPDEEHAKSPVFQSMQMPYYTRPFTSELVGVVQQREVHK